MIKYGNRRVPKMYAIINRLRALIASSGNDELEDTWGEVEQFIDFSYAMVGLADSNLIGPWMPIDIAPESDYNELGKTCLLCSTKNGWIRFGRKYMGKWYYSGTNERSQYSMVEGDEPTHWTMIPKLPLQEDQNESTLEETSS